MESDNKETEKYYKGFFYFDRTTKRIFVYNPYSNRYTLNFVNKWSYVIFSLMIILIILIGVVRWLHIP
jgi:uncharacterized membrane protein